MYCNNCGSNLKPNSTFCESCGAKVLNQNMNVGTNSQNVYSDEDLIDAYIGKNAEKIKQGHSSNCAFWLGIYYVFYRKMWLLGIIWWVTTIIIGNFLPSIATVLYIVVAVVISGKFNQWYLQSVKDKVAKIKNENVGASREQLIEICKKKGGTSLIGIILVITVIIVYIAIVAIISIPQTNKILNNAKKSAAEDSSYGVLKSAENLINEYYKENGIIPNNVVFNCDGTECSGNINGKKYTLDIKGTKPTAGSVKINSDGEAQINKPLKINGFTCKMDSDWGWVSCS